MYFSDIHFGEGVIIARFHNDGKHWAEIERILILMMLEVWQSLYAPSKSSKESGQFQPLF